MIDDDLEVEFGTVLLMLIDPKTTQRERVIVCHATGSGRVLMLQDTDGRLVAAICQVPHDPLKN